MTELSKVPLVALSIETKTLVSTLLNPTKWIPTDDGLPRDWRGLAHLSNLDGQIVPSLESHSDPTGRIITMIETTIPNFTLEDFRSILGNIDRWDIVDDSNSLFERDAEKYLERMERCDTSASDQTDEDKRILTIDDLYRFRKGLDNQYYDAFLLYSDEDIDFVKLVIENLEKDNLKLCTKDRDLVGGITFEHEAVMQLISERCNRLIVIVSPNFLKSPANKFFLNYAQAVGIEMQQRKVIPCLYQKCQKLPRQLSYTCILDYNRVGLYDFWGRLRDSVSVVATEVASNSVLPTQKSVEKDDKLPAIEHEDNSNSWRKSMSCENTDNSAKSKKRNKLIPWPRREPEISTEKCEEEAKPTTEIISVTLSLPSLDNLPSLDMESVPSCEPAKRKKNLVGTCVKKVKALLLK